MEKLKDSLDRLYPLTIIALTGSLHGAARRLRTSQPALTQLVKSLESELGTRLFVRSSKGVRLTAHGEQLCHFAQKLLKDVDRFAFDDSPTLAAFRIGTYESIAEQLVQVLGDLPETNRIHFHCEVSGLKLIDLLNSGEVDYIILADPPPMRGIRYKKICDAHYGLYVTPDLRERHGPISSKTISDYPLIFVPGSVAKTGTIDRIIGKHRIGQTRRLTVNSYVIAREMTLAGMGLGLLVDALVRNEVAEKRLVPTTAPGMAPITAKTTIFMGYREGQEVRPHFQPIFDCLCQALVG